MTRSWEALQSPLEKILTTGDTTLKTITVTITPRMDSQIPGTGAHTAPLGTGAHGHTAHGDITIADGTTHGTTVDGMTHGTTVDGMTHGTAEDTGDGTTLGTARITTDGTTHTGATTIITTTPDTARAQEEATRTHGTA